MSKTHISPDASIVDTGPLAQEAIAEDSAIVDSEGEHNAAIESSSNAQRPNHGLGSTYRRPSYLAVGQLRAFNIPALQQASQQQLCEQEEETARQEERSLLRDNALIPPKRRRKDSTASSSSRSQGLLASLRKTVSRDEPKRKPTSTNTDEGAPSETTTLLPSDRISHPTSPRDGTADLESKWEDAVIAGKIQTTWQRETKVLMRYSGPLLLTFLLQYSLTVTSVFTVGHIGKVELGAVSLATMTASITGYGVYQGMCTALDTLCAQAYGSGHKHLVGLQMQRMILFLLLCSVPIACIWLSSTAILMRIVYEKETAELAGQYLKIVVLGMPGYLAFESGKRFVQAQGLFNATLCVLLIVAPLNAFLHWLFVWHLQWGFVGAPIAVVITETLLPIGILLYVIFVGGRECWGGVHRAAFRNWGPMIRLAIPGLIMVEAETLAFEILTLAAARLGSTELAAQSVLNNLAMLLWEIPFSISIAASTRVANLIGATLVDAAKVSARVAFIIESGVGLLNMILMSSLRFHVPQLFTNDGDVVDVTAEVLPVVAAFQLFDALAACCNGILRGIGRQEIGGVIALLSYYVVGLPISFAACFGLGWGLLGLWIGPAIGLAL